MRLIDYLCVPYRLEAATTELADGSWVRRVAYPELPDCMAESTVVEDALCQLERRRIEMIVRMVADGCAPPVPRPPLHDCDPAWVARQVAGGASVDGLFPMNAEWRARYEGDRGPEAL